MKINVKKDDEPLLDSAVALYLINVDDACRFGKIEVVTRAHKIIERNNYETETDYFTALTQFIINNM